MIAEVILLIAVIFGVSEILLNISEWFALITIPGAFIAGYFLGCSWIKRGY